MTSQAPDSFIKLSSILTGFTEGTLTIALQSADYYSEFIKIHGQNDMAVLLKVYASLVAAGLTDQQIGERILDYSASGGTTKIAQSLMIFWYTGQIQNPPGSETWVIPNGNIYAQALSWRAIQAHASGVSNQKFGYWASKPADLKNYL